MLGFGLRGIGLTPASDDIIDSTPQFAAHRFVRHDLPCIGHNVFGWGVYYPHFFSPFEFQQDTFAAGLLIKSPSDNNWIAFRIWGLKNGTGSLQFQCKEIGDQNGFFTLTDQYSCKRGEADVYLKLEKRNNEVIALCKNTASAQWREIGRAEKRLPPL